MRKPLDEIRKARRVLTAAWNRAWSTEAASRSAPGGQPERVRDAWLRVLDAQTALDRLQGGLFELVKGSWRGSC